MPVTTASLHRGPIIKQPHPICAAAPSSSSSVAMPFAMLLAARHNVRFLAQRAAATNLQEQKRANMVMRFGASLGAGLGAAASFAYLAGAQSGSKVSRKLSQSITRSWSTQPLRQDFLAGRLTLSTCAQPSKVAKKLPKQRVVSIFTRSVSSGGGGGGSAAATAAAVVSHNDYMAGGDYV